MFSIRRISDWRATNYSAIFKRFSCSCCFVYVLHRRVKAPCHNYRCVEHPDKPCHCLLRPRTRTHFHSETVSGAYSSESYCHPVIRSHRFAKIQSLIVYTHSETQSHCQSQIQCHSQTVPNTQSYSNSAHMTLSHMHTVTETMKYSKTPTHPESHTLSHSLRV